MDIETRKMATSSPASGSETEILAMNPAKKLKIMQDLRDFAEGWKRMRDARFTLGIARRAARAVRKQRRLVRHLRGGGSEDERRSHRKHRRLEGD
ncbi:unnamed protein product [Linum trigynum]|uniref:Uncharacterized protein n=1 Tax=Linum trigynum TaxID=586398 RepID=A0AAV2GC79_9ROSI